MGLDLIPAALHAKYMFEERDRVGMGMSGYDPNS